MSTRIVVLGGGFAGVSTAQELARDLRRAGRLVAARRPAGRGVPGRPDVAVDPHQPRQLLRLPAAAGRHHLGHDRDDPRRRAAAADAPGRRGRGRLRRGDRPGGARVSRSAGARAARPSRSPTTRSSSPSAASRTSGRCRGWPRTRSASGRWATRSTCATGRCRCSRRRAARPTRSGGGAPDVRRRRRWIDGRRGRGRAARPPADRRAGLSRALPAAAGRPRPRRARTCCRSSASASAGTRRRSCARAGVQLGSAGGSSGSSRTASSSTTARRIPTATVVSTVGNAPHPVVAAPRRRRR